MMSLISPVWIVQTLIASTLLMALVLAVRAPVMRAFGPRVAYALWLLPALRMILPPLPGWRTLMIPIAYVGPHRSTIGLIDPASAARLMREGPGPLPAPEAILQLGPPHPALALLDGAPPPPIDWAAIAVAVWLGGALLLFATQLLRYRLFLDRALRGSVRLSRECGIDVLISGHVSGPIAAGILKRRILLPGNFLSRYTSEERRLALKHEAAHHDRLDIPANLLALGIVALHWWNPLAHRAYRAFRADQELACDATVLAEAAPGERHPYGSAMLKSASGHMPAMACALSHKDQLKKRIGMMARGEMGMGRLLSGVVLAATAIGGGL
ncbi:M56 family metallopeptidase, partial [Sphingomonas bacterium]|uniref:M56 family metallopeptidase n=1 Tax=Sphingomonas bacterium TaxID=1895847 RepID=UPI001C2D4ED0